jgi:hypothetical protein
LPLLPLAFLALDDTFIFAMLSLPLPTSTPACTAHPRPRVPALCASASACPTVLAAAPASFPVIALFGADHTDLLRRGTTGRLPSVRRICGG